MENKSKSYRSGRFYIAADEWFFSVREAEDQGPYSSKQMAEESLRNYLSDSDSFKTRKTVSDFLKIV